ncbi:MAG: hypothetical protein K5873_05850, partial [Treponema sp.]|nr:hypothetical protein [Treponema sp.]
MKKFLFFLLFFYVLLFLVGYPLLAQFYVEKSGTLIISYPPSVFFNALIAFFIYFFALKGKIFQGEIDFSRQPFFLYLSIVPLTFGFLCLASCLFEGLSYFLK